VNGNSDNNDDDAVVASSTIPNSEDSTIAIDENQSSDKQWKSFRLKTKRVWTNWCAIEEERYKKNKLFN